MHRTHRMPTRLLSLMLGLTLAAWPVLSARAQPPAEAPKGESIVLPVGSTQTITMSTKKKVQKVQSEKPDVVRASTVVGHPDQINLTGGAPGIARVILTDEDGKVETFEVVVQVDLEYLRYLLGKAVPTANVQLLPGANGTILMTGYVSRAEDLGIVQNITRSVVGDRFIDAVRVGGVMQVQLDVVVATVARNKLRQMSFAFQNAGARHFIASTVGLAPVVAGSSAVSVGTSSSSLTGSPGNLFLGLVNDKQSFFGFLAALKTEGVLTLMAEPKLISLSGKTASFLSGGEQAIPVPAGLGQVGVQFEEFGTRLNFLPLVLGNGRIHLEVEPEVSNLNAANGVVIQGTTVPGRDTQRVHTTVELETGQTYVIGGLISHARNNTASKVPILGELPFLGAAFSTKTSDEHELEMLVIVTPHLVDAMSCDQTPKLLPGEETRSPDDFELFLEGILEAPRGPRQVCHGLHYEAAYKNSSTAGEFPCAGSTGCSRVGCSQRGACGTVGCGTCGTVTLDTPQATSALRAAPMPLGTAKAPVTTPVAPNAQPDAARETKPAETTPAAPSSAVPATTPLLLPPPNGDPQ